MCWCHIHAIYKLVLQVNQYKPNNLWLRWSFLKPEMVEDITKSSNTSTEGDLMARHAPHPQDTSAILNTCGALETIRQAPVPKESESPSKKHSRHTYCWQPHTPEPPMRGSLLYKRWHQVTASYFFIDDLPYPVQLIFFSCLLPTHIRNVNNAGPPL